MPNALNISANIIKILQNFLCLYIYAHKLPFAILRWNKHKNEFFVCPIYLFMVAFKNLHISHLFSVFFFLRVIARQEMGIKELYLIFYASINHRRKRCDIDMNANDITAVWNSISEFRSGLEVHLIYGLDKKTKYKVNTKFIRASKIYSFDTRKPLNINMLDA